MTRELLPVFRLQSNITKIGALEKHKTCIFKALNLAHPLINIYLPFSLIQFEFAACFPLYNIYFSILVFDSIQSVETQNGWKPTIASLINAIVDAFISYRADKLPRPSFFATPCKVFTGLPLLSLPGALSPLFPLGFLLGLEHLLLALSPSLLVAGLRELYTSRADRPCRSKSCRPLISLLCSESCPLQKSSSNIQIFVHKS